MNIRTKKDGPLWDRRASIKPWFSMWSILGPPMRTRPEGLSAPDQRQAKRGEFMKRGNSEVLRPELQAELEAVSKIADDEINTTEMPEVTDWSKAVTGAFYRPVKKPL